MKYTPNPIVTATHAASAAEMKNLNSIIRRNKYIAAVWPIAIKTARIMTRFIYELDCPNDEHHRPGASTRPA
jgi:hypothetical protein